MGPTASTLQQHEDLITAHMPMAARIARSFAGRGQDLDDLTQVAMLELVRAASKFDLTRGFAFPQYAYPCIIGGLKKHFRDNGWSLHITRRMQELHLQTSRAIPALTHQLSRHPTVADLAAHLHLSEKDTRDGMQSRMAYSTQSLNVPKYDGQDTDLEQSVGGLDEQIEAVPDRVMLAQHMAILPKREQTMLRLRFFGGLTQREISEQLGVSQMHVSRMLTRSIERLRTRMLARI